jgi:hypothetical protein
MKLSLRLIQFLIPLAYSINAANGFIAHGSRQSCGIKNYQRSVGSGRVLFQEQSTIENKVALNIKGSSADEEKDDKDKVAEEDMTETQKMLAQVKEAGLAGVISYALWELGFWAVSVPVCIFGYYEITGHWPDLSNSEDQGKLGAEAFAFVNFARFAVPLRIGLALGTTPWIDENIVRRFLKKEEEN